MSLLQRVGGYVCMHGAGYTVRRAAEMFSERVLRSYHRSALRSDPDVQTLQFQREHQPDAGLISVAVPVYNTRPIFLTALAASLKSQTYAMWEAVLYDGGSTSSETVEALRTLDDPRIRVIRSETNAGIAGNTNLAVAACHGGYIALCDHDDTLAPDALWRIACEIEASAPDMLYSDEDKLTEDGAYRTDPHYKPDFCPDNLRSGNYICHLMVIKRELLDAVGGLRPDFDGSQDHDLALRIVERTNRIAHIPHTLYHWRTVGSSMSHLHLAKCLDAAACAVTEHMTRIGYPGTCRAENGVLRLRYDVPETLRVAIIQVPMAQGYAFMNRAAAEADADVLLYVHESVAGLRDVDIRELLMYAQREDVGAVTPMLTDRTGHVTHAGFALTAQGVVCRNAGLPANAGGWHGMNRTSHNVLAVSAACLMIRRDHFIPFDESWQDGLGAVDWCMRLRQRGLLCVYTPHVRAVCTKKSLLSSFRELARFREKWPDAQDGCISGRSRNSHTGHQGPL